MDELLAELCNVPVRRADMATLRPGQWLNDEVINYFFTLLGEREKAAAAAADDGGAPTAGWPRCHFVQTNFYTKLAESSPAGYVYKNVARWTRRADVFSKDLIIVPIHCHGNHWTLAVINLRQKRFEYYDSLFGSPGAVLTNLRRWLADESVDKKKGPLDLSDWTELVFTRDDGTPVQRNGSDCGVFMSRTADFLARDGKLSFGQGDMNYFRRRMVLEILQTALFPP
jgi:sentrin-specific protease 1